MQSENLALHLHVSTLTEEISNLVSIALNINLNYFNVVNLFIYNPLFKKAEHDKNQSYSESETLSKLNEINQKVNEKVN